jgi:CubicO group peptidase (beta-lactamase class C family)
MRLIACVLGAGLLAGSAPAVPGPVGMDRAKLDGVRDALAARRTKSLLVVHNGEIVYEWYAPDHGPDARHSIASTAKAIVGGVSLMLALQDGHMDLDDPRSHRHTQPVSSSPASAIRRF